MSSYDRKPCGRSGHWGGVGRGLEEGRGERVLSPPMVNQWSDPPLVDVGRQLHGLSVQGRK
jgi:hypothetical protein